MHLTASEDAAWTPEALSYHRDRARAELDMAYRAATQAAAEAHLRLSSLHMQRLKDGQA